MAMTLPAGRAGRIQPAMNVTPLVDVVLVLLIIFMVITPLLSKQFYVHLPKEEKAPAQPGGVHPVVLRIAQDGALALNGTPVELDGLSEKLKRVFAARNDHVLFFEAADEAPYGLSMQAIDKAREGGAVTIAAITGKTNP